MSSYQSPTQLQPSTNEINTKSAYSIKERVRLTFPTNSRWTKQSFKDECDINTIMRRYIQSGEMPVLNQKAPQYLDCTGIDYQQAMEFIAGAKTLFGEMPADIREKFENDPAQFLDFCSQEKNRPEMAEMGLLRPDLPTVVPLVSTDQNKTPTAVPTPSGGSPENS